MTPRMVYPEPMTIEEFETLPETEGIEELSCGFIVREPPPSDFHARLVTLVSHILMKYVDQHPGCGKVYSEGGFVLSESPATMRQPDIAFVRMDRVPPGYKTKAFRGAPDLAIEIQSPSNRAGDTLRKISEFLDAGTPTVWVIDPATETVVIHDQSGIPQILSSHDRLEGGEILPGLSIDLAALFANY